MNKMQANKASRVNSQSPNLILKGVVDFKKGKRKKKRKQKRRGKVFIESFINEVVEYKAFKKNNNNIER